MQTADRIKKLIFFRSAPEVDAHIKNRRDKSVVMTDDICIAMTPRVYSYLRKKGFEAQNTIKYFTNDSHRNALTRSKILTDWLRNNSYFADPAIGARDNTRESFILWTRCAINHCLWMIEVVLNAADFHKQDMVTASYSDREKVQGLYIEPEERYLGYIVKNAAGLKNIRYEDISKRKGDIPIQSHPELYNCDSNIFRALLRYVKFLIWEKAVFAKGAFFKERPVIFTTTRNMESVLKDLRDKIPEAAYYFLKGPVIPIFRIPNFILNILARSNSEQLKKQREEMENLANRIKKEGELFSYRGVQFAEVISQKIRDNMTDYCIGLMLWSITLKRFVERSKAAAFISDGNRLDDIILGEICLGKGIPTIFISHGSHVSPKDEFERMEWGEHGRLFLRGPFSHLALQSPLAEGYIDEFQIRGNVVKTGPIVWGKPVRADRSKALFEKMFDGRFKFGRTKVILHAGTPKPTNALRFYVYETPDEYIQSIANLADAVENIPGTILIVKFRPLAEIRIEDLKGLVRFSDKVILSVGEPFRDVLGMANLLVSFSSTTIEEALQNRIPVLLYGGAGDMRYQHIPAYEIIHGKIVHPQAAYCVKEAETLRYALRSILNLNIDRDRYGYLFEPYIYSKDSRMSLAGLLLKEEGEKKAAYK